MSALEFAIGLVVLLLILLVSIALHELGHLLAAKHYGIPVRQYMVGFGPTIWSKRYGGTEYGLKALPLGGYVRMKGMYPDADDEADQFASGTPFYRLRARGRVTIMAAGPLVNLALALLLLFVAYWGLGAPAVTASAVSACTPTDLSADCATSSPASPASTALEEGDILVAIDGRDIREWNDVVSAVRSAPGEQVNFTILRAGELLERTIQLAEVRDDGEEIGYLGVTPGVTLRAQSFPGATAEVLSTIGTTTVSIVRLPVTAATTAVNIFADAEPTRSRPVSLIGAGHLAGAVSASATLSQPMKIQFLILLAAQLNLALFLINMVPLPPFDGGHIAASIYQAIRDRIAIRRGRDRPAPVNAARLMPLTLTVLAVFLSMSLVFMVADVIAPVI